ncbi:MAG: hypothetical protein QXZ17_07545 [Nitrososphaerota archaeon]
MDSRVLSASKFPGITNGGHRFIIGIDAYKLNEFVYGTWMEI